MVFWLMTSLAAVAAEPLSAVVAPLDGNKIITVGDPVHLNVSLTYPQSHTPPVLQRQFPTEAALLGEESVAEIVRDGQVSEERVLRLALFKTGEITLGPLRYSTIGPAGERLEFATNPVTILVTSVLREDNPESAPPAPPWIIPYPTEKMVLSAAVLIATVAAILLGFWYFRIRRRQKVKILPDIPPHLEARQKLYALAARDLPGQGQIKPFYFLVSEIIKDYLGKELGVRVLERTTAEIVGQLPEVSALTGETCREVRDFLQTADQVKFAGHIPSLTEVDGWQRQAYELIQEVHADAERCRWDMKAAVSSPPAEEAS
ncbi:MAG: hypothetical protein JXQ27_00795 [Acidobacteria bacterium]|nr:hypothetical protein [Acidobacteriota bacterium]